MVPCRFSKAIHWIVDSSSGGFLRRGVLQIIPFNRISRIPMTTWNPLSVSAYFSPPSMALYWFPLGKRGLCPDMDAAVELMLNAVRSSDPDVAKVRAGKMGGDCLELFFPWDDYSGLQELQFRTGCNHHMQWDVLLLWSPYWPALNPCEAPWTPEFQPESSSETTHHPETLKLVSYSTAEEFEGHQRIDDPAEFLALISRPFIDQSSRSPKKNMPLTMELWSFLSLVFAPYFWWSTPKLVMVKIAHCNCNRWSQWSYRIIYSTRSSSAHQWIIYPTQTTSSSLLSLLLLLVLLPLR